MVFQGEMMTCDICGRQERSDPQVESGWTVVELNDGFFYICNDHFNSKTEDFELTWKKIFEKLTKMSRRSFWL